MAGGHALGSKTEFQPTGGTPGIVWRGAKVGQHVAEGILADDSNFKAFLKENGIAENDMGRVEAAKYALQQNALGDPDKVLPKVDGGQLKPETSTGKNTRFKPKNKAAKNREAPFGVATVDNNAEALLGHIVADNGGAFSRLTELAQNVREHQANGDTTAAALAAGHFASTKKQLVAQIARQTVAQATKKDGTLKFTDKQLAGIRQRAEQLANDRLTGMGGVLTEEPMPEATLPSKSRGPLPSLPMASQSGKAGDQAQEDAGRAAKKGKRWAFPWAKRPEPSKLSKEDRERLRVWEEQKGASIEYRSELAARRREKLIGRGLSVRQTGIFGTMVSGIRLLDRQVKTLVLVGMLVGILFIPVGFFTFAGWSIVATAMLLISAVYFVFLNLIKVIASAIVGFINAVFTIVAGGSIALIESVLKILNVDEESCTFSDGTTTTKEYTFCSGREIADGGLIKADALNAINIPLLDPKKLMPEMDTTPLAQYIGKWTGLYRLDLGSFFANAIGGRLTEFVDHGSIYRVVLVFVVPTVILGVVIYVKLVKPALVAAGAK